MRGAMRRSLVLALACAGAAFSVAPASAQSSYSQYAETPSAALARYVRLLASTPTDFSALIGAGRAALAVGDAQAAAGFFARADEANPRSPLPQAGMQRAYPAVGRLPATVVTDRNSRGRTFYRFQIGTTSQAHSEVLCQRMQTIHFSCAVVGLPWKAKVER